MSIVAGYYSSLPEIIKVTKRYQQLSAIWLDNELLWINLVIFRRQMENVDWLKVTMISQLFISSMIQRVLEIELNRKWLRAYLKKQ